jgi:hypothetical protein
MRCSARYVRKGRSQTSPEVMARQTMKAATFGGMTRQMAPLTVVQTDLSHGQQPAEEKGESFVAS